MPKHFQIATAPKSGEPELLSANVFFGKVWKTLGGEIRSIANYSTDPIEITVKRGDGPGSTMKYVLTQHDGDVPVTDE